MPKIGQKLGVTPFWSSACENHKYFRGNAITILDSLPEKSIHCAITSPPYWPLRKYFPEDDNCEIGREDKLEDYLDKMVSVFDSLGRVLRDDGTFWLNIGDSRIGAARGRQNSLPFKMALTLEEAGWILRQDIIWRKPNPCPDGSTTNRCTRSHEYIFLFVKKPDYYFDMEPIRDESGANKRSVWDVVPEKLGTLHKAIFSRKLIEPCILAGTSEQGVCDVCGAPLKRITKRVGGTVLDPANVRSDRDRSFKWSRNGITGSLDGDTAKIETVGWERSCKCDTILTKPATVIDPFVGSGTTSVVAASLGRRSIGIDLSKPYLEWDAIPRLEKELSR